MSTEKIKFESLAMSTFDAMRLFIYATHRPDTVYTVSTDDDGDMERDIITFDGFQLRGSLTRDSNEVALTVIPKQKNAPDFTARKVVFERKHFARSVMMSASKEDFFENKGSEYAKLFASLFERHLAQATATFLYHGGSHLLLIDKTIDRELIRVEITKVAQAADAIHNDRLKCLIGHAALDIPADLIVIDDHGRVSNPDNRASTYCDTLKKAVQLMPNALRLTHTGHDYPQIFTAAPHRFTVEATHDRSTAHSKAISAAAGLAIRTGSSDIL